LPRQRYREDKSGDHLRPRRYRPSLSYLPIPDPAPVCLPMFWVCEYSPMWLPLLPGGRADAGAATAAVAPNIIASASKTESLLFKASLLHFSATFIRTIARITPGRIPHLDYFHFDPTSKILVGWAGVELSR
jgi:hypothetical protein